MIVEDARTEIAAAVAGRRTRGEQDDLLRIESRFPGFAGYRNDPEGFVLMVKRGSSFSAKELSDALTAHFASATDGIEESEYLSNAVRASMIDSVEYSLSELIAMHTRVDRTSGGIDGLMIVGPIVARNRLLLAFESQDTRALGLQRIVDLGIPSGAVEVVDLGGVPIATSTWQDKQRPTRAGIRTRVYVGGKDYGCSLGFNVRTGSGAAYFLTASHCFNNPNGVNGFVGANFYQATLANGTIGSVSINPAWAPGSTCPPRSSGEYSDFCTNADVAAGSAGVAVEFKLGTSQYEGTHGQPGTQQINNWYPIAGTITPLQAYNADRPIHKSGATTGTTTGDLAATCATAHARSMWGPIGSQVEKWIAYTCIAAVFQAGVGTGDSGGPVFARLAAGGPYYALGLEVAGGPVPPFGGVCQSGNGCFTCSCRGQTSNRDLA